MRVTGFLKMPAIAAAFCFVMIGCTGGNDNSGAVGVGVNVRHVSAGGNHTVAIGTDGTLWAWGNNHFGQLGDGTIITHRTMPTRIGANSDWAYVSAGWDHTAAVRADGTLWTWGWNNVGQLGDGTMGIANYRNTPAQIGTDTNWVSVSAGSGHTAAIRTDGTLWVWGNNENGQLGIGTVGGFIPVPVQVQAGTLWESVSAGSNHTAAIRTDGSLWAWGFNGQGRLGDGTTTQRITPVRIGADNDWASVSAGNAHTAAVRTGGTLWTWGFNGQGRLGDGTTTNRSSPVQIHAGRTWTSVSAGSTHTAAIMENGTLWAWGFNSHGRLGSGVAAGEMSFPSRVRTMTDVTWASIYAGGSHTVAVGTDGTLWAWGNNWDNQLGDDTMTNRYIQIQVMP